MRWLRTILRTIFGLFVDDAGFAIVILAWVGLVGWVLPHVGVPGAARGPVLFVGLAAILVGSAARRARK